MIKKKSSRILINMECVECRLPTSTTKGVARYLTEKNKKNTSHKLEFRKFCKFCMKHTLFSEKKK